MINKHAFLTEKNNQFIVTDSPTTVFNQIESNIEYQGNNIIVAKLPNFYIPKIPNLGAVRDLSSYLFNLIIARVLINSCIDKLNNSRTAFELINTFNNNFKNPLCCLATNVFDIIKTIDLSIEMFYENFEKNLKPNSSVDFPKYLPIITVDISALIDIIQKIIVKPASFVLLVNGDYHYNCQETMLINNFQKDDFNAALFVKLLINNNSWVTIQDIKGQPILNYEIVFPTAQPNTRCLNIKQNKKLH